MKENCIELLRQSQSIDRIAFKHLITAVKSVCTVKGINDVLSDMFVEHL